MSTVSSHPKKQFVGIIDFAISIIWCPQTLQNFDYYVITNHPTVKRLCQEFGKPLVSTSANLTGQETVISIEQAKAQFAEQVGFYVDEPLGGNTQPSTIKDAMTGKIFRG